MSERAERLHATADEQIAKLIDLISTLDPVTLRLPCPGREKLGDGTLGAVAHHTAENYQRIASFVGTRDRLSSADTPTNHGAGIHDVSHRADTLETAGLVRQLADARQRLTQIAALTDRQLDTVPSAGSFRFCDGQRTLDQVLAGLFTHQAHQFDTLRAHLA